MLSDVIFHDFTENSRGGIKHFTLMLLVYIIYLFSHFKSDSVILLVVFCVILLIFVTLLFIFYSFHYERFCVFLNVRSLCCFFCCFNLCLEGWCSASLWCDLHLLLCCSETLCCCFPSLYCCFVSFNRVLHYFYTFIEHSGVNLISF